VGSAKLYKYVDKIKEKELGGANSDHGRAEKFSTEKSEGNKPP
jgi:hypothetical protein